MGSFELGAAWCSNGASLELGACSAAIPSIRVVVDFVGLRSRLANIPYGIFHVKIPFERAYHPRAMN